VESAAFDESINRRHFRQVILGGTGETYKETDGKITYGVDVLYCYSNPKAPWSAQVYSERNDAWKGVPNFPWISEKE
jgi:hypothetical protein